MISLLCRSRRAHLGSLARSATAAESIAATSRALHTAALDATVTAAAPEPPTLPLGFIRVIAPISPERSGQRLDACLASEKTLADGGVLPSSMLHNWSRRGLVRVQPAAPGSPLTVTACNHRMAAGESLHVHASVMKQLIQRSAPSTPASSPSSWFRRDLIRHMDDRMVVICKPAGVPTQGGTGIARGASVDDAFPAIEAEVDRRLRGQKSRSGLPSPSFSAYDARRLKLVHRLDRDVSGLLILARGKFAAGALSRGFQTGSISKTYVAVVAAPLPPGVPSKGTITAPVVHLEFDDRMARDRQREPSSQPSPGSHRGKAAPSAPPVLDREDATTAYTAHALRDAADTTITLLFLEPLTGRKHQLRQHVLHLFKGAAGILGDSKYSAKAVASAAARKAYGLPPPAGLDLASQLPPWPPALSKLSSVGVTRRLMLHSLKAAIPRDLTRETLEISRADSSRTAAVPSDADARSGGGGGDAAEQQQQKGRPSGAAAGSTDCLLVKDPMPPEMAALLSAFGWPQ